MKVNYNDDRDDLYCVFCKNRINLGEKYAEIEEECLGEKLTKIFHVECIPILEED